MLVQNSDVITIDHDQVYHFSCGSFVNSEGLCVEAVEH